MNDIIINNFRSTGLCGNYPDIIAVRCKTEKQAKDFLNSLPLLKWFSGEPLAHNTYWSVYSANTCYCLSPDNEGVLYSNVKLLSSLDFTIIDWSEFPKDTWPNPLAHFYDYKRFYNPHYDRRAFDFSKFLCKNNFSVVCCNSTADAFRFCKNLRESSFWSDNYMKKADPWIIGGWDEDEGNVCFYFDSNNDRLLHGAMRLFEMAGDFEYIDYKYYD